MEEQDQEMEEGLNQFSSFFTFYLSHTDPTQCPNKINIEYLGQRFKDLETRILDIWLNGLTGRNAVNGIFSIFLKNKNPLLVLNTTATACKACETALCFVLKLLSTQKKHLYLNMISDYLEYYHRDNESCHLKDGFEVEDASVEPFYYRFEHDNFWKIDKAIREMLFNSFKAFIQEENISSLQRLEGASINESDLELYYQVLWTLFRFETEIFKKLSLQSTQFLHDLFNSQAYNGPQFEAIRRKVLEHYATDIVTFQENLIIGNSFPIYYALYLRWQTEADNQYFPIRSVCYTRPEKPGHFEMDYYSGGPAAPIPNINLILSNDENPVFFNSSSIFGNEMNK